MLFGVCEYVAHCTHLSLSVHIDTDTCDVNLVQKLCYTQFASRFVTKNVYIILKEYKFNFMPTYRLIYNYSLYNCSFNEPFNEIPITATCSVENINILGCKSVVLRLYLNS